jgi:hypothetical protein
VWGEVKSSALPIKCRPNSKDGITRTQAGQESCTFRARHFQNDVAAAAATATVVGIVAIAVVIGAVIGVVMMMAFRHKEIGERFDDNGGENEQAFTIQEGIYYSSIEARE